MALGITFILVISEELMGPLIEPSLLSLQHLTVELRKALSTCLYESSLNMLPKDGSLTLAMVILIVF